MIDQQVRRVLGPPLASAGRSLARAGVRPLWLTGAGWLVGVGACVAAGLASWWVALVLWLVNRALDGLDGPVARARGATELGGFLDLVADFTVYAGFVLGVSVAVPDARVACVALVSAYYASGTALLVVSSLAERHGDARWRDERSLRLPGGLAEGTETVVAYVVLCLVPAHAAVVAWVFAAVVAVTAAQRVWWGVRLLRHPRSLPPTN